MAAGEAVEAKLCQRAGLGRRAGERAGDAGACAQDELRQQVLVRALLQQGFDFGRAVANPDWVSTSGPGALDELRDVDPGWRFRTLTRLRPATIDGKAVLVRHPWWRPPVRRARKPPGERGLPHWCC